MIAIPQQHFGGTKEEAATQIEGFRNRLLNFVRRRIADVNSAEDVVQDAIVSALENLGKFKGLTSFEGWVFGITKRKVLDFYRRRARVVPMDAESDFPMISKLVASVEAEPVSRIEYQELEDAVARCVSGMPKIYSEVFALQSRGISTAETARRLNITPENVWIRMHRARKLLKKQLCEFQA